MAERPRVSGVVLAVVGVVGLCALVAWTPFLRQRGDVVLATPGPPPIPRAVPVPLPRGRPTCVDTVTIDPGVVAVRTTVLGPRGVRGGPIDVRMLAEGGREVGSGRIPGGFAAPGDVEAPVAVHLRRSVLGVVCFVNRGPSLDGAGADSDRTRTRSTTTVAGEPVVGTLVLTLVGRPASPGSRAGAILRRAATFKPVTAWEIGVLAVLLVLGIPAGLTVALVAALRADEAARPRGPLRRRRPPGSRPAAPKP